MSKANKDGNFKKCCVRLSFGRGQPNAAKELILLSRCESFTLCSQRCRDYADDKLGQCIVRSEFSEYFVTARVKRLQIAASRRKRLPLPADARANHDDASEDEHGGDAHCEAHGQTARPLFTL